MKTTKSPRRVLEYAHLIGKLVLPDYSHPNSPKIFTQPQLFACLVLKEFLRLDYRKLEALLIDAGDLAAVIGLDRVPTFSCFQKAAKRLLLNCHAQRYLDKSIRIAQAQRRLPRRVSLAALDGTGLESQHVSHYYVKRRAAAAKHWQKTTYQRFPKAGILCDTKTHLVLAVVPERGPGSDVKHFRRALTEAQSRVKIDTLAADAGYDGEHHHRFARERCGVRSLIPPRIGRPTTKPPSGYWRRQMKQRLHLTRYSQRWQVETVNSMLKRLLGSALRARKYWSQCREILLRAITLNIMILRRLGVFYRATVTLFFGKGESGGVAYAVNRSLNAQTATEQDVVQLMDAVRLLPCKRCSAPAFDPESVQTNRDGLCEPCFLADLNAGFDRELEDERLRTVKENERMKAKGMRYRVMAWIHGDAGDDCEIVWYFADQPKPSQIRALLREEGSELLNDFQVVPL